MASALEVQRELEWRLCARDPLHFLNNYWQIETIGSGYEVTGLRSYQEEEVRQFEAMRRGEARDHRIALKARQIGWTTIGCGFGFWDAFFHEHHPWIAAQQSEDEAKKTLSSKVKQPYLRLPAWMRDRGPRLLTDNTEEMVFDNGSSFSAIHSGAAAARSRAVYGVIMDEAGFIEDPRALFGALEPLCYGLFLVYSTANGMGNWFHEIWQDSELPDSEWSRVFQPWSAVPERDEAWYAKTKRRYRTTPWLFYQEYPSTPAEAFSKSGRTALPLDVLEEEHDWAMPDLRLDLSLLDLGMAASDSRPVVAQVDGATIADGDDADLELWVYELPYTERDSEGYLLRDPNFVVSADVSEGLDDGDYSSITVLDANTGEEVASAECHIPYEDLGPILEWIGYWYYTALIGVERNNQGLVPLQYLSQNHYPRLYRMDTIASQRRGDRTPRYGWHTNKATKPKMVIDFTKALRTGGVALRDPRFLKEARTFLADGKGGYSASPGNHDDKIISVLIAWQLRLDVGEYPIVWVDRTQRPLTMDEVMAIVMPQEKNHASPLDAPIGHSGEPVEIGQRSWVMLPSQVRRSSVDEPIR